MITTRINASEPGWTSRVVETLEQAASGDIIVISTDNALDLVIHAAKRMERWPLVRIMTEETYQQISHQ